MITVQKVIVKCRSLEHLDVSWEISNEPVDLSLLRFTVTRSESPEGPFEAVSPPLTDRACPVIAYPAAICWAGVAAGVAGESVMAQQTTWWWAPTAGAYC